MAFPLLIFLVITLGTTQQITAQTTSYSNPAADSNWTINVLINSRKEQDGDWVTSFQALKTDPKTTNITLNLTQSVYQCDDDQIVHIKGVIRAMKSDADRLMFHPNCGKNAAISNDGRSVEKIILNDGINGVVLTNRLLRRNELFEVQMDKKNTKFNHCMAIGVTTYSPDTMSIPDHMFNLKSGNWMMYHSHVYVNGVETVNHYGKSLNELKVGDRVGVMVNNLGTLHFFVNGIDQGPAASNMPLSLYGVFELYYNTIKGTIVDSTEM